MPETVSKKECAARLNLTTRQITNLVDAGMPRNVEGNRVSFPWPDALHWYIQYRIDAEVARNGPADFEAARARKMAAEAELAELELAQRRGLLLTTDDFRRELEAPLVRVRAALQNVPGKYAPRCVGLETPAIAQGVLDEVVREAMTELARVAGESDDDDPADTPERAA